MLPSDSELPNNPIHVASPLKYKPLTVLLFPSNVPEYCVVRFPIQSAIGVQVIKSLPLETLPSVSYCKESRRFSFTVMLAVRTALANVFCSTPSRVPFTSPANQYS